MKLVLLKIRLFCYVFIFCLFTGNIAAQCTLTIDSTKSTNVTCNGDTNGTIIVYTGGGRGMVNYNDGGSGSPLVTQQFNTNVLVANGSTSSWYIPGFGDCSNESETPYYPVFTWSSSQGCPAGSAVYQGDANWGYEGCFMRTPQVNMNGINTGQVTFDLTNNASGANDYLEFSVWVPSLNNYLGSNYFTVNGKQAYQIFFDSARNCSLVTVTFDLSTIATNSRTGIMFYFTGQCNNGVDCSDYLAVIDNVSIAQASTAQTSNTFTGLGAGTYTITVTDSAGCTANTTVVITQPNALTATVSPTSPTTVGGANGTAVAIVSGGTAPYTYTWNTNPVQHTDTATNLPAGSYTVTVTDNNNCTTTASATVAAHSCAGFAFSSVSNTNVACYGGATASITASVNGGTAPYDYELNNNGYQSSGDFTHLAAGSYTLKAEDTAGCTLTYSTTIVITQPNSALNVVVDTFGATGGASNGKIIAVATGGKTPYQYSITGTFQASDTFTGLAGGKSYCVTVVDNNACIASACGEVSGANCATITINSTTDSVKCFGGTNGSATISASGGAIPYQYSLNGGAFQESGNFNGLSAGSYSVSVKDANNCTGSSSVNVLQPGPLNISAQLDSVLCNGGATGAILVAASGGTPPYQYSLNGGAFQAGYTFPNLAAGAYTVHLKDKNNCTSASTDTVLQPSSLLVSVGTAATSTIGGSDGKAYALASGGTSPYNYTWSNIPAGTLDSITGLSTGNYCVTVSDFHNCTVSGCGTVSQPNCTGFYLTDSVTNASASASTDGAINITFIGATLPITFTWNNGDSTQNISGLSVGYYCVTATDEVGCTAPLCDSVRNDITSCYGLTIDSVIFTNSPCPYVDAGVIAVYTKGGLGTILYSVDTSAAAFVTTNTFNNLPAGSYTIEVEDTNDCLVVYAYNPVTLNQPAPDTVNITQNGDTLIAGYFSNASYTWYWNNTPAPGNDTLQTYVVNDTVGGTYKVQVFDSAGCNLPSNSIVFTGINSINGQPVDLTIYPNPFSEVLNVTFNSALSNSVQVELFDLLGKKLYEDKPAGNTFTIPTTGLAQGMYLICLQLNGQFVYRRVVKD